MLRSLFISVFVLLAQLVATGQDGGCKKIDSEQPSIYIAFEREEKSANRKKAGQTFLRLVNNTSCGIHVETDDNNYSDTRLYRSESRKRENGGIVTTYTQLPVDRLAKTVFYETAKAKSDWSAANFDENRDLVIYFTIFPGLSTIFPVATEHTRKPFRVSVSFSYQWEGASENTSHRVFYYPEMPKGFYEPPN